MDDSIEAYQAGMEKFNRYFTAENDSGIQNFIQDFKEMRSLGEGDDWISNIGNTAQLQQEVDSIEHNLPYYGSYHIFQHRVFHLLNKPLRVLRFFSLKEAIATINPSSVF